MLSRFRDVTTNRVQHLSSLLRFALRSPVMFARASREGLVLIFDHELTHTSPLRILPDSMVSKFHTVAVQIPPLSYFGNGTQSVEGLCSLVALCKVLCAHNVFEIGTFTGVTAFTLAINMPSLMVETLDLPVGRAPALDFEKSDRTFIPLQARQRVFEGRQEAARIVQHEGDSASFNFGALGRRFDLVYVDGAHSYDYVANDSRAAFDIVADGGAIVWDDYQPRWPGVVRYLNERSDLSLFRLPGTRLVLWLSEQAKSTLSISHRPADE
jgi:predicted O-methyltransferase YrrM